MCQSVMTPLLYFPKKIWVKVAKNNGSFKKSDGPANRLTCTVTIHKRSEDGFHLGD